MTECLYAFWGPPSNADDFQRCTELTTLLPLIAPVFLLICIVPRLLYSCFSRRAKDSRENDLLADEKIHHTRTSVKSRLDGETTTITTVPNGDGAGLDRQQSQHSQHHIPADWTRRTWHKTIDFAALSLAILMVGCTVFELIATIQWTARPAWTLAVAGAALQLAIAVFVVLLVYQSRLTRPCGGSASDDGSETVSWTLNELADRTTIFLYFLLSAIMQAVLVVNNASILTHESAANIYDPAEHPPLPLFAVQCIILGLTVLIMLVYGVTPRSLIRNDLFPSNPLPTASPLMMLTFAWITPMMYLGWRQTLKVNDLWQLEHSKTGKVLYYEIFRPAWLRELQRVRQYNDAHRVSSSSVENVQEPGADEFSAAARRKSPSSALRQPSLMRVLLGTIAWRYAFGILLLCCSMVFKFTTPMLLKALLGSFEAETKLMSDKDEQAARITAAADRVHATAASDYQTPSRIFHQRFMLALLLFMCSSMQSIFDSHLQFTAINFGFGFTKTIVLALYEKALRLSNDARRTATVGQLINLIMVDAQKFFQFGMFCYFVINAPITIVISIVLIWRELGAAAIAGVAVLVILIPLNGFISTRQRRYFAAQLALKDERLRQASEMVNGIRILKLYAWEAPFISRLLKIRAKELRHLRTASLIQALASMLWSTSSFFILLATFAAYVLASPDNVLTAQKTFVALALFNLLREPLNMLSQMVQFSVQFRISLKRVSTVLLDGERDLNVPLRLPYSGNAPAVHIEHGNFAWSRAPTIVVNTSEAAENFVEPFKPTLRDINLTIQPGTLTAIVGQVGSGKSSLCAAILGQMDEVRQPKNKQGDVDDEAPSSVVLRGSTSYVPQQAWIRNATLLDNIIFLLPFDKANYERILDACALRSDLEMLAAGDNTEIGEKGLNLSGGQKQRVALARAAYSGAQVVVLDDPLSAVDAHVGKHIFQNLIANKTGLLKRATRIMATHNVHLLPFVDNIVVMQDGQIVATGTYDKLIQAGGPFAEFLSSHVTSNNDAATAAGAGDDAEQADDMDSNASPMTPHELMQSFSRSTSAATQHSSAFGTAIGRQKSVGAGSLTRSRNSLQAASADVATAAQNKQQEIDRVKRTAKLIEEEQAQLGRVEASVYWTYAKYVSLTLALLTVVLAVAHCALSVGSQIWLAIWSSDVATSRSVAEASSQNIFRLTVYAVIGSADAIAILLQSSVLAFGALLASRNVHELVLDRVMHAPTAFFDTTPSGRILNRFSRDVDMMDSQIPDSLLSVLNALINIAGMLCVVVYGSSPWFLLAAAPLAIMYVIVQRFAVATATQVRRIESILRSPMVSHFGETIQGLHVISAMNMERQFQREFERLNDQATRPLYCFMCSNRWINVSLQFIGSLIVLAASVFAILQHGWDVDERYGGSLSKRPASAADATSIDSSSAVGLVISNALSVTGSLAALVRIMSMLENAIVSVERMKEYTEIIQENDREPPTTAAAERALPSSASSNLKFSSDAGKLAICNGSSSQWPQTGTVEFDNYEARYRPGLDLVLRGITERIEDGEKVGVVGRTGAGKSSFALALFRMIQPTDAGTIRVDGRDIRQVNLFELRSRLSIIPQDPIVFSGTLRFNLDPWAVATDDELWKALRQAHLHAFVTSLPAGLEYQVGSDGQNLSVGQKQLVCLARALLRRSKILVLDEATAAVDLETDELIQESIRREFAQSTVITIAHRINTIIDYNRVMVLANGKVQEIGAPQALLERGEASEFYRLAMESARKKQ